MRAISNARISGSGKTKTYATSAHDEVCLPHVEIRAPVGLVDLGGFNHVFATLNCGSRNLQSGLWNRFRCVISAFRWRFGTSELKLKHSDMLLTNPQRPLLSLLLFVSLIAMATASTALLVRWDQSSTSVSKNFLSAGGGNDFALPSVAFRQGLIRSPAAMEATVFNESMAHVAQAQADQLVWRVESWPKLPSDVTAGSLSTVHFLADFVVVRNQGVLPGEGLQLASLKPVSAMVLEQQPSMSMEDRAKQVVLDWAEAWKSKNIPVYLDQYVDGYAPRGSTHEAWRSKRHQVISKARGLDVQVHGLRVRPGREGRLIVNFEQAYASQGYSDRVRKQVHLQKVDGNWKIMSERVLAALD